MGTLTLKNKAQVANFEYLEDVYSLTGTVRTNDANDWAIETMGNPRYPLELLQRVINVSLKTQEIVRSLPVLEIKDTEGSNA